MAVEKLPIVQAAGSENRNGFHKVFCRADHCKRLQKHTTRRASEVELDLWHTFYGLVRGNLRWPLYLWGDTGRGKTFAALCFTDALAECGWTELDQLCEMLVGGMKYLWQRFSELECLVVDEIGGRDIVSSVDADAVKKIADLRERYGGRVAIYISNHEPDKIQRLYGRRIFSRLCCGTTYQVTGPDRRMG